MGHRAAAMQKIGTRSVLYKKINNKKTTYFKSTSDNVHSAVGSLKSCCLKMAFM
jgi:hypothetical protein